MKMTVLVLYILSYTPSHDNPFEVTPDNTSRQTLQNVAFAWEHEYQLWAPDNLSNKSDCCNKKNTETSLRNPDRHNI